MKTPTLVSLTLLIAACGTTDPNARQMPGGPVSFESSQLSPKAYLLVATGSGGMPSSRVEEAFDIRARELCGGDWFSLDSTTYPAGTVSTATGPIFVPRNVFRSRGTVTCK